jgi:hypothetical protein
MRSPNRRNVAGVTEAKSLERSRLLESGHAKSAGLDHSEDLTHGQDGR